MMHVVKQSSRKFYEVDHRYLRFLYMPLICLSRVTLLTSVSATNKYSPRALERAGVTLPTLGIITSNDVSHGKPHPAPYLAGAAKCAANPNNCKYTYLVEPAEIYVRDKQVWLSRMQFPVYAPVVPQERLLSPY